jgi:hypothetical protein
MGKYTFMIQSFTYYGKINLLPSPRINDFLDSNSSFSSVVVRREPQLKKEKKNGFVREIFSEILSF